MMGDFLRWTFQFLIRPLLKTKLMLLLEVQLHLLFHVNLRREANWISTESKILLLHVKQYVNSSYLLNCQIHLAVISRLKQKVLFPL